MRPTRAFWASAGAGLSLVAAAMTVLFVFSAVVAVKGWPGIDPDNDVPTLVLSEALPAGGDAAVATAESPEATAAGPGSGARAAIVLGGGDGAARRDGPASRTPGRTPGGTPVSGSAPSSGGGGGQAGGSPVNASPQGGSGGTPSSAGQGAEAPVGGAIGAAPSPVSAVTDTAADVVEGGGQAVGGATQNVAPPVSGTVESVTGTTGGALRDAGGAVDSATQGDVDGAAGKVGQAVGGLIGG